MPHCNINCQVNYITFISFNLKYLLDELLLSKFYKECEGRDLWMVYLM
jgi:hypothetical protein